jgi:hypothetical protein
VTVRDPLGSVIDKVDVDIKVVAFWSKKYAARAKAKRFEVLAKALDLVANPSAYNKATHFGAAKYVDNIVFDKKSGIVIEDTSSKPCSTRQSSLKLRSVTATI